MPQEPSSALETESVEATFDALLEFLDRFACMAKFKTMDNLSTSELTFSQMKVLFALGAHDQPMSVNEIADHVHLSLAAAGRTVDKLVGEELVDRREDPADRRVKRVSLTTAGSEFVDSHLSVKQEVVRRFVAGLPETVRVDLRRALTPIVDADAEVYFDINVDLDNQQ